MNIYESYIYSLTEVNVKVGCVFSGNPVFMLNNGLIYHWGGWVSRKKRETLSAPATSADCREK